ncbi:CoA transferase [Gordonia mangrovi]|nr:CoA transferase [Gordonia mangrovi]
MNNDVRSGPIAGIRVVEFAGIGPGPHAAMLLADLGADVVRVQRPGLLPPPGRTADQQERGRSHVVEADLKSPNDIAEIRALINRADVVIEGFRPGVVERLGLGPDACLEGNPRLIYARMTGWGQAGPLAMNAGHDINYIALSGVLHAMGPAHDTPQPPLNMIGDFGGGSLYLVIGVLAAIVERERSGAGQVVDAAMVDGTLSLSHFIRSLRAIDQFSDERGTNLLDGSAPFYRTYETGDGGYVAVGALEEGFYTQFVAGLGLDAQDLPDRFDRENWASLYETFAESFRSRTRDEWADIFAQSDACVTPVLTFAETASHEHIVARESMVEIDGVHQHRPAPRFSRSSPSTPTAPRREASDPSSIWRAEDV